MRFPPSPQNPKCADTSVTGSINVTSNICMLASDRGALPPAASCPAYPAAMASLVEASGGLLPSEFARKLSAYCPSNTASAIKCETQLQAYAYMCESRHYWHLCRRQALTYSQKSSIECLYI